MLINPVIKPDVMNILSSSSEPEKKVYQESNPQPPPKPSKWEKAKGFFKKAWEIIKIAAVIIPPVLNSISRIIEAKNQSNPKKINKSYRPKKKYGSGFDGGGPVWAL